MDSPASGEGADACQGVDSRKVLQLRASLQRIAEEVAAQKSHNDKLRELLARERRNRIHRISETRRMVSPPKAADQRLVASPQKLAPLPTAEVCSDIVAEEQTDHCSPADGKDMTRNAAVSFPTRSLSPIEPARRRRCQVPVVSASHPLLVGAQPELSRKWWSSRHEQIFAREAAQRTKISVEQHTNFLLIHRVLRLLRKDSDDRLKWSALLHKQRDARNHLAALERQKRVNIAVKAHDVLARDLVMPFEQRLRAATEAVETAERKAYWVSYTREWKLRTAAEARRENTRRFDREACMNDYYQGRVSIMRERCADLDCLSQQFSDLQVTFVQSRWAHYGQVLEDARKKRLDALEQDAQEEKKRRLAKQKALEAKHSEEKRLHQAWVEMEKVRSRLVRFEQELWLITQRAFRLQLANVAARDKLRRVEGYFHDALHEMPTISLNTSISSPVSAAYASQLCPNHATTNPPLLSGQLRPGMSTTHSFAAPRRRDSERLPKHLRGIMSDETSPLFVGSYLPHHGLLLDPTVDFCVDMGETWCARLLICWSYAREEGKKLSVQMLKRLYNAVNTVDTLAKSLADDATLEKKTFASKKSIRRLTTASSSEGSSDATHPKTDLFADELQDITECIPKWLLPLRKALIDEIVALKTRFPKATSQPTPPYIPSSGEAQTIAAAFAESDDAVTPRDAVQGKKKGQQQMNASMLVPETLGTAAGALCLSGGCTPVDVSLARDAATKTSEAFALERDELHSLRSELALLKESKERIRSARLKFRAVDVPGDIFADKMPHRPLLTLNRQHLETLHDLYSDIFVEVDGTPYDLLEDVALGGDSFPSVLEVTIRSSNPSSFVSPFAVRDAVRLVRAQFTSDVDSWCVPSQGVACPVEIGIMCDVCCVPSGLTIADVEELQEVRGVLEKAAAASTQKGSSEVQFFILPPQVFGVPDRACANEEIAVHDCRSGKHFIVAPRLTLRLCPRLERSEEMTFVSAAEDDWFVSSIRSTSPLAAPAPPPDDPLHAFDFPVSLGKGGSFALRATSPKPPPHSASSKRRSPSSPASPCMSIRRSSNTNTALPDILPAPRVTTLRKPVVERRTTISLQGDYMEETECKGLELAVSIYDGFCLEDYLELHDPTGAVVSSATTGDVWVHQQKVAVARRELCTIRIVFAGCVKLSIVEQVCRCVALKCGQYTSRIGIRVLQVVLARPYDKHASSPARWVPPAVCYLAVRIVATDVPPTFFAPDRVIYRSSIANTKSASSAATIHNNLPLHMRPTSRIAIAASGKVDDPDTQVFCGGSMFVSIQNFDKDDYLALDLREYDATSGADGLRMEFVVSVEKLADVANVAYRCLCDVRLPQIESAGGQDDFAYALLRYNGLVVGVLQVRFSLGDGGSTASDASGPQLVRRMSVVWGSNTRRRSSVALQSLVAKESSAADEGLSQPAGISMQRTDSTVTTQSEVVRETTAEPEVQRPSSSLIAETREQRHELAKQRSVIRPIDGNASTLPAAGKPATSSGDGRSVMGVSELWIAFDKSVPFPTVQTLVRSVIYYRSSLMVPQGETAVDFTLALGATVQCFDVHGDAVPADGSSGPDAMHQRVIIERSPPLLVSLEKDKPIVYPENSGLKKLFGRFAPMPQDVSAFEGGFLRVEIVPDDIEEEDEIVLDLPTEKLRRVFLRTEALQPLLPDSFGAFSRSSIATPNVAQSSKGGDDDSSEICVDFKAHNAKERKKSFMTLEMSPREPPHHSGPPVHVSALQRLQSLRRSQDDDTPQCQLSPLLGTLEVEMTESVDEPLLSPAQSSFKHTATTRRQSVGGNLWRRVKKDVNATGAAHKFIESTFGEGEAAAQRAAELKESLYHRVFDLVRQVASSQVQLRRQQELDRFGIDEAMILALHSARPALQSNAGGSGLSRSASISLQHQSSTNKLGGLASGASGLPRSKNAAQVCCLADYDENYMGTMFSRTGYLCIAFDATPASQVFRGHNFVVDSSVVMRQLLPHLCYRSTSRNPSILEKRIILTLSHPSCGQSVLILKVAIEPVDDPVEFTLQRSQVVLRSKATEEEPYSGDVVASLRGLRQLHGVNAAMPESSSADALSRCEPRHGIVPLLPFWTTSLFDPDTFHWDGGRCVVRCAHFSLNGASAVAGSRLPATLADRLRSSLNLMTLEEQRTVQAFLRKNLLPELQWYVTCQGGGSSPGSLCLYVHSADDDETEDRVAKKQVAELELLDWESDAMRITFVTDRIVGPWITLDIVKHILCAISVDHATALSIVEEMPSSQPDDQQDGAPSTVYHSVSLGMEISLWDAVCPQPGKACVSVDILAPLLRWQSSPSTAAGEPSPSSPPLTVPTAKQALTQKGVIAATSRTSTPPQLPQGAPVVAVSLRDGSTVQGEPCFAYLSIRLSEKDRVGGGFMEISPISGTKPEDKFSFVLPNNQLVITTDGSIIAKEGTVGRVYGAGTSYLRVDLAGYFFEGSKKVPPPQGGKQELLAPPGVDPVTMAGCISPLGSILWWKQVSSRVGGKRLSSLIKAVHFRTEQPDGVPASSLVGLRRFRLTVSDGWIDAHGRLEATSMEFSIHVSDVSLQRVR